MNKYDVVQFKPTHKWGGCLGIIKEVKPSKILVGVEIPEKGIAYIYAQADDLEPIGIAKYVREDEE